MIHSDESRAPYMFSPRSDAGDDTTGPGRVEIRDLTVERGGRPVLERLSLTIRPGEVFGLLGPNGAGKTTTFQVLTGLLVPRSGEFRLDGESMRPGDPRFLERTGIVFQEPALDPRLSVRENLLLAAGLYGVPRADAKERIRALLDRAELTDRAQDPVAKLSGGMRRKVELARALIHEPSILVLDEPSSGLDEGAFRRLWTDLLALRSQRGLTLLLTTHRAEEAAFCDRLAILDQGRIIACDTPQRLREQVRGDVVILETDRPEEVAGILEERLGLQVQCLHDRVALERERAHELIPRLVESLPDGSLRSVSVRHAGLGEVFLHLTGRELEEEQGSVENRAPAADGREERES